MKNNLKKLRETFGITITELAEETGINRVTISQYEKGTKNLKKAHVQTILKIADALKIEDIRIFFNKLPRDYNCYK